MNKHLRAYKNKIKYLPVKNSTNTIKIRKIQSWLENLLHFGANSSSFLRKSKEM
jgi:hypothetical protein